VFCTPSNPSAASSNLSSSSLLAVACASVAHKGVAYLPFHVKFHRAILEAPVVDAVPSTTPQVRALESSGGLLDAQKLLLCAGVAMQDVGLMFHVSRAMMSAAQELRCLQVTQEHV
jgi:hypothetical protein